MAAIEIEDLQAFLTVLDSGGFNRAAQRLGLSKSIVSRRIARLEAALDAALLTRSTRGVRPSEAGLALRERAERIMAELEEARAAVTRSSEEVVGRLRVAAPLSFGIRHVAPLLSELAERHPRLELEVSYSDRRVDLPGDGYDLAIRIGTLEDSSLVARRLAPVRATVVASPAYLARHGRPEEPKDLLAHECLIYSGRRQADWRFRVGRRWVAIRPRGRLRSDSGEAIIAWAAAGLGIAEVPSFLIGDAFDSGRLVPLLRDYPLPEAGIYAVRLPGQQVPAKVRVLIDALVERFGGEPFWDACLARERGGGPQAASASAGSSG